MVRRLRTLRVGSPGLPSPSTTSATRSEFHSTRPPLAVIPATDVARLWDAIDFTPDDAGLSTVGGLVEAEALANATLVEIADGRFHVETADGDHLVCLLDGSGPYALRGCAWAIVSGPAEWSTSHGEGRVSLSTD